MRAKSLRTVAVIAAITLLPTSAAAHQSPLVWSGYTWHVHNGTNGAGQCQSPSHVTVSGGHLFESVSNLCGGGVSMTLNQHHGTWSATYRMTRGAGKYVILLWPANGSRPEVDFAEDKPTDALRTLVTATYHPLPGCTACIHAKLAGDYTQWHTASVHWTSNGYAVLMDGHQWAFFKSSYAGQQHLAIQVAAWGVTGSSTLEVASVHVGP